MGVGSECEVNGDHALGAPVFDGVVQQIFQHLLQQARISPDASAGVNARALGQPHVHVAALGKRLQAQHHGLHGGQQWYRHALDGVRVLNAGQLQHLLGVARGRVHLRLQLAQKTWLNDIGFLLLAPPRNLRFKHRQGRAQLVGGIFQKPLPRGLFLRTAREVKVQRLHQRPRFFGQTLVHGQRGEVVHRAGAHQLRPVAQGGQPATHHPHQHGHGEQQQQTVTPRRTPQKTAQVGLARGQVFGHQQVHINGGRAGVEFAGGRVHLAAHGGHAQVLVKVQAFCQVHRFRGHLGRPGECQPGKPRLHQPVAGAHMKKNGAPCVALHVAQQLEGPVHREAPFVQLGGQTQGLHCAFQAPVVGLVNRALGQPVGECQLHEGD